MEVLLWIISGLLAFVFLLSGSMKLIQPKAKLVEMIPVLADIPESQIKIIGGLEVAGAIGIILPWLLDIAALLTPLAALGLVATMSVAFFVHQRRGETPNLIANVILGLLALFVAISRFGLFA